MYKSFYLHESEPPQPFLLCVCVMPDHYDGQETKTWQQRYFFNTTFFNGSGPVYLCVGGETPLDDETVVTGNYHCADMV